MQTEKITNRCPKCQAPLPTDAPRGLCAKCLLAAAATQTEAGQPPGGPAAPPPLDAVRAAFPQLEIVELIGQGGMAVVYTRTWISVPIFIRWEWCSTKC